MGNPVVRYSDMCTGHSCYPPRPNMGGSSNVFVNGRGVHRKGDYWPHHKCKKKSHNSALTGGSGVVFANRKRSWESYG